MSTAEQKMHSSSSPTRGFKSHHLNTIRSMHMIQELQSYIESLEMLAQQQKEEINRVTEQNRVYARQSRHPTSRPKFGEEFAVEGADLPPKLRAIIEDNRVLKERAKKYKDDVAKTKKLVTSQEQEILKLQGKISHLHDKVVSLSESQGDPMSLGKLQEKLQKQDKVVTDLEHRIEVLTKSKETDSRKYRNLVANANKKSKEKDVQIKGLQESLGSKEKELKSKTIDCKTLQRKLTEPRRQQVAAQRKKVADAPPKAASPQEQQPANSTSGSKPSEAAAADDVLIKLVINVNVADSDSTNRVSGDEEAAAAQIQSRYKGYKTRREVAKSKEDRNQAAIKIQAAHRGKQVRRQSQAKQQAEN